MKQMQVSQESVNELENVLVQYEEANGTVSLEAMSECTCAGTRCANSCDGTCDRQAR